MRIEQLEQLSVWLAATDITVLELSGPGVRLRLRHDGACVEVLAAAEVDAARPPGDAVPAEIPHATVRAGSVGIFLCRHPMREAPLAPAGTRVRAGQAVGLLQVGCLLLGVSAPADGAVAGTLVPDGAAVGFGTPLLELHAFPEAD